MPPRATTPETNLAKLDTTALLNQSLLKVEASMESLVDDIQDIKISMVEIKNSISHSQDMTKETFKTVFHHIDEHRALIQELTHRGQNGCQPFNTFKDGIKEGLKDIKDELKIVKTEQHEMKVKVAMWSGGVAVLVNVIGFLANFIKGH